MMRYAAALEYLGHSVSRPGHFPRATAGREVDVATPVLVEKPRGKLMTFLDDLAEFGEVDVLTTRLKTIFKSQSERKKSKD